MHFCGHISVRGISQKIRIHDLMNNGIKGFVVEIMSQMVQNDVTMEMCSKGLIRAVGKVLPMKSP